MRLGIILSLLLSVHITFSQQYALPPAPALNKDRLKKVVFSEAALGIVASAGLYFLWYKKFCILPSSKALLF